MNPGPFLEHCVQWLDENLGVSRDPLHAAVRRPNPNLTPGPSASGAERRREEGLRSGPNTRAAVPSSPAVENAPRPSFAPSAFRAATQPSTPEDSPFLSLRKKVAACQACGLAARRKRAVSFGNTEPCDALILTDYPEFYDEVQGRYFSGDSAPLLENILKALGLSRSTTWVTGALKCHSTVVPGSDLTPFLACREHFLAELSFVRPRVAIGFGELAYRLLFERDDFHAMRGRDLEWNGLRIRFTHHPRDFAFDPALKRQAWDDMKSLKRAPGQ